MEHVKIILFNNEIGQIDCILEYSVSPPWCIYLYGHFLGEMYFEGDDIFESFRLLRLRLQQDGWFSLCNGARVNAFPSSMSRQMVGGCKLYILTLGRQSKRADLVNIFDEAPVETIGTVEEQEKYYQMWLDSLK